MSDFARAFGALAHSAPSLPNTKPRKYLAEDVFDIDAAGDAAERVGGLAEVFGAQFGVGRVTAQEHVEARRAGFQQMPVPDLRDGGFFAV